MIKSKKCKHLRERGKGAPRMKQEKIIQVFSVLLICACVLTIGWSVFDNGRALEAVLFDDPSDTGMDFFNSIAYTRGRVPYTEFKTLYPPLANLFYFLVMRTVPTTISGQWSTSFITVYEMRTTVLDLRLVQNALFLFIVSTALCGTALFQLCCHGIHCSQKSKMLFSVAMLSSLGVLQALERGNIILWVVCLVLFFLQWKDSPSKLMRELALVSLGIAAGLKLYPAIFGLVLLFDRQYAKALRAVLYGLILFFAPFFFFEGLPAMKMFFQMLFDFNDLSTEGFSRIGLSLSQMVDTFFWVRDLDTASPTLFLRMQETTRTVTLLWSFVALVLCFFTQHRWKILLIVSLLTILFPARSAMYGLCMMIVPALAFFSEDVEHTRFKWLYISLFFLVLAFFPYSIRLLNETQVLQIVVQGALLVLFSLVQVDILSEVYLRKRKNRKNRLPLIDQNTARN